MAGWSPPSVSDRQVHECWDTFTSDKTVIYGDSRVGLAIVIGITSHYGAKGVPADIEKVKDTFNKLNFAVWKVENPTEAELEAVLKAASTKRFPNSFKCIVVYFAGHGGSDSEEGSFIIPEPTKGKPQDKPRYYIQKGIVAKFAKPLYHLFFFDCCLSSTAGGQGSSSPASSDNLSFFVIPKESKFLIAYATSQEAVASGSTFAGGEWTQILMANIENYDLPVTTILDITWEDMLKKQFGKRVTMAIQKPHYVTSVGTFSLRDMKCVDREKFDSFKKPIDQPASAAAVPVVKATVPNPPKKSYLFKDIENKRPNLRHLIAALKFMENDERTWKWFGELLDPDMKGNWPYGCTLERFLEDVYDRKPLLSWGDVRRAMRQPTADKKGYPLSVKVNGEKKNCEDLLLEHMSDKLLNYVHKPDIEK